MTSDEFTAVVSAGSLRRDGVPTTFPHQGTGDGVVGESVFTGAHLMRLAVAGCALNDTYREASTLAIPLDGVRVTASGDFARDTWQSTGITYSVEVGSSAPDEDIARLLAVVDDVAEVPKALRAEADVRRP